MFKGRRLWAYVLDGIILGVILLTLLVIFAPRDVVNNGINAAQQAAELNKTLPQEELSQKISEAIKPFVQQFVEKVSPVIFATQLAYLILSIGLEFILGGSLGKKLAGLKVVDKDNKYVTLLVAVQRNFFHVLVLTLPTSFLGSIGAIITLTLYLVWFFMINSRGQTISDIWFNAFVVKKTTSPAELESKVEL
jgi:uncharacterized RDD family membrane protein YckC